MKKLLNRLLHFMRVLYGLVVVLLALMRMVQPAPEQLQPPPEQAASRNETEPKPQEPESPARRRLMIGGIGLVGAAISGAIGVPVVAFFVAPLLQKPAQEWRDVGPVDSFEVGSMTEVKLADPAAVAWSGATEQQGVWLRRVDAKQFQAFSINCTHLGCPVHWIDTARLFMCPCHGGVFYEDGRVAAPPPARPLEQHQVRIADSHVQVLTHELAITGHFPHLGK